MKELDVELIRFEKLKHIRFLVNRLESRKEHIHNEYELFFVLSGSGKAKIKNKTYSLAPGDVYFINSSEIHSYHSSSPIGLRQKEDDAPLFLFAQISNHFLREYFPQIRTTMFESGNLRDFMSEEEAHRIISLLLHTALIYFQEGPWYQLPVVSHVAEIMRTCYANIPFEIISEAQKNTLKAKKARIERIISYIDANFESQIRLQDLADQENLSPTHFSHLFVSLFNVTFQEYVSIKRMEAAIRLMGNREKTLLEISYESGFSDPKYMNKMFLKYFGCTPKQYRENLDVVRKEISTWSDEDEHIYSMEESRQVIADFLESHPSL